MKALILNSGQGKRLLPLTKRKPKALLKVRNKTLLGYQMDQLLSCNIRDIIITTGPFEKMIKKYVKTNYPYAKVSYIRNPYYKTTNYIFSMWLARKLIDDDVILLHGDLLFERRLLRRLINCKYPNCVLVNRKIRPPEKDFKAKIINNRIIKIDVNLFEKDAFFLAPIYKFSKYDFLLWLNEIDRAIKGGRLEIYAEAVFNNIADKVVLHPLYFSNEICLEIDTIEDLKLAKNLLKRNILSHF